MTLANRLNGRTVEVATIANGLKKNGQLGRSVDGKGPSIVVSNPEQIPTNDLLQALAAWDVLDAFQTLPLYDQDKFLAWIERAPDEEAYRRRIDILVLGMRMAPPSIPKRRPQHPDYWMNPMGRM